MDEIFYWSAKKLAEAIRAKELSSLEIAGPPWLFALAPRLKACPLACR